MRFGEEKTRQLFSFNIMRRLRDLDISQAELARRIGVDDRTVSYYINKRRTPSLAIALEIAQALDCSLDDLVN